ncbi:riboflavin kinase [Candidatus Peregrinibacteria bacterium]|nr:riboflavin kinase [Candidatus Peregrinibacteria bacterium]
MHFPLPFKAHVIAGSGRGRKLGVPTLNVNLAQVPSDLEDGIYACFVNVQGKKMQGALHMGPRPVFQDSRACEVHLIGELLNDPPQDVEIEIVERLREIRDFPSAQALQEQMREDIDQARAILAKKGR